MTTQLPAALASSQGKARELVRRIENRLTSGSTDQTWHLLKATAELLTEIAGIVIPDTKQDISATHGDTYDAAFNDGWNAYRAALGAALSPPADGVVAWTSQQLLDDMAAGHIRSVSAWPTPDGSYSVPLYTAPPADSAMVEALRDMIDWLDDGNRQLSDACEADVKRARTLLAGRK